MLTRNLGEYFTWQFNISNEDEIAIKFYEMDDIMGMDSEYLIWQFNQ
ncbi:MAG: hypothetical protein RR891_11330 [Clostridium sp.]